MLFEHLFEAIKIYDTRIEFNSEIFRIKLLTKTFKKINIWLKNDLQYISEVLLEYLFEA